MLWVYCVFVLRQKKMAHGKNQDERPSEQREELGEETFLKDLHLYMKKRNTPIEKIPHLGFKQSEYTVLQIKMHMHACMRTHTDTGKHAHTYSACTRIHSN